MENREAKLQDALNYAAKLRKEAERINDHLATLKQAADDTKKRAEEAVKAGIRANIIDLYPELDESKRFVLPAGVIGAYRASEDYLNMRVYNREDYRIVYNFQLSECGEDQRPNGRNSISVFSVEYTGELSSLRASVEAHRNSNGTDNPHYYLDETVGNFGDRVPTRDEVKLFLKRLGLKWTTGNLMVPGGSKGSRSEGHRNTRSIYLATRRGDLRANVVNATIREKLASKPKLAALIERIETVPADDPHRQPGLYFYFKPFNDSDNPYKKL